MLSSPHIAVAQAPCLGVKPTNGKGDAMRLGKRERIALRLETAIRGAASNRFARVKGKPWIRNVWSNPWPRGKRWPNRWGWTRGVRNSKVRRFIV